LPMRRIFFMAASSGIVQPPRQVSVTFQISF
jgi:hypothetical protein